jgi:hypothetical protein
MSSGNAAMPSRLNIPSYLVPFFAVLVLAGTGALIAGLMGPDPLRVWQAYLINYLFWTGVSSGAMVFIAVLNMTGAGWGRSLKRPAEAFGAFLPVGFVLFLALYFGRLELFPWIREPVAGKEVWLNVPFLFIRNSAGLLLFTLVALALIYFSLKGDRQWREYDREKEKGVPHEGPWSVSWKRQQVLSPVLGIAYAFVLTLLSFDLIMSLDRGWYSTLFGGYFLVGSFYSGIAAIYLLALLVGRSEPLREHVGPRHFHDLGKLLFAFSLFTGYLFYVQFLTIWYGNLPAETRYVILRVKTTYWEPLAWTVLFTMFVIPFLVLLSRRVKLQRTPMILLSLLIMAGMWLEKLILVAPSLWKGKDFPLGVTEVMITAGFFGVMGLCLTVFLRRVSIVPISDPLFRASVEMNKERLEP